MNNGNATIGSLSRIIIAVQYGVVDTFILKTKGSK